MISAKGRTRAGVAWLSVAVLALLLAQTATATIYNWQTGQPIPGTEGIAPGPGVNLSDWNTESHSLRYGDFRNTDLNHSDFDDSWLDDAHFGGANLTSASFHSATLSGADLSGAILMSALLRRASLTSANLTDAMVQGAYFGYTTSRGFTKEQLYSTASWKAKDLTRIGLAGNDLSGWNLAGQNLTAAHLGSATLTGANLADAVVQEANLGYTTSTGFAKEQLYSTASWKAKDLTRIDLAGNDLSGWNLAGQNLTSADFFRATLSGADLSGANLTWAFLKGATLTGVDLTDANLTSADLSGADLTLADLRKAQGASLAEAVTRNTIRPDGKVEGLNLLAGDTLVIRNCDLAVTVQSAMTLDGASVLESLLERGWGSTVAAPAGAVPDLGGTLYLGFAEGPDPATLVGQTFDIFNWNGPLDAENRFDDVCSEPWASWDLGALYTTGEVTLLAVPEPATLSLLVVGGVALLRRRRR